MWVMPLLGYLGTGLGLAFLVAAVASGLYYLSELVEEHSVLAKKTLSFLIYAVIGIQVILTLVDRLPVWRSGLSILSHLLYSLNLRRFPIVKLADPVFIASCILVLVNHWIWYSHFTDTSSVNPRNYKHYKYAMASDVPTFTEIASFFGIQVWLVPFSLFISLSAGEFVLPSMGSEYATGEGSSFISPGKGPGSPTFVSFPANGTSVAGDRARINAGMAKAAVNGARDWLRSSGEALGLWQGDNTRMYLRAR